MDRGAGTTGAGSTETAPPGDPVTGGTIVYATDVQPVAGGLDPYTTQAFASWNVLVQIYEPLLAKDADGTLLPALAESWEQPDETTYVFTLREGVTFSDGSPLTASDVVYSLDTMRTVGAQSATLAMIAEVVAVDEATVQVATHGPSASLLNLLSSRQYPIVSEAWYSAASEQERQAQTMDTGPWVLTAWQDNVSVTLAANDGYWDEGLPYADELVFEIVGDETSRAAQLRQGGGTQMAWFCDPTQVSSLEAEGFHVGANAATRSMFMYINAGGPMADVRVRQAVSKAMDREQITELAMAGRADTSLVVPTGDPAGVAPDATTPNYTRDVEGAKALLAEAGESDLRITLTYASDAAFALDVPMVEVMQAQLAEAGITLELEAVPWADVLASYTTGEWEDLLLVPGVYQPDPAVYFAPVLNTAIPTVSVVDESSPRWRCTPSSSPPPTPRHAPRSWRSWRLSWPRTWTCWSPTPRPSATRCGETRSPGTSSTPTPSARTSRAPGSPSRPEPGPGRRPRRETHP